MFGRKRKIEDFNAEIEAHLALEAERLQEHGLSEEKARAVAHRNFGNVTKAQEQFYESAHWLPWDRLWQDVRFALRMLRKNPGFAAVAILTIALGIGANTTVFSVVNAFLFQPILAKDPEQIVAIFSSVNRDALYGSSSYMDYRDIESRSSDAFQDVAGYTIEPVDLSMGNRSIHVTAGVVSANYFQLLGANALLGRTFLAEEGRLQDPRAVAVLSEGMWREHFAAAPDVIGRSVLLNRQPFIIIGVMDEKHCRLRHFFGVDLFVPAVANDVLSGQANLTSRKARQFFLLGRLAPGIGIEQAQASLTLVATALHREDPDSWSDDRGSPGVITVVAERDARVPPNARFAINVFSVFLLCMVGTVLLIACANLATLALARALNRRTEIAVRISLGASRWRVIRQLLAENLFLSLIGAGVAIVLTRWTMKLLMVYKPPVAAPIGIDLVIDQRVLLYALFLTILTTVLFGLTPALCATGADVMSALKETAVWGRYRRFSLRGALIVAEVALSITLLMPTGLFIRSFQEVQNLDIGFKPDHLALISTTFDSEHYTPEQGKAACKEIAAKLSRIPGVTSVDFASVVPLSGMSNAETIVGTGARPTVGVVESNAVGPHYFETMRIPFVRGRGFEEISQDHLVAVVNEAFARTFWPNQNPVGEYVGVQGEPGKAIEIVGEVTTGKYEAITERPTPYIYRPIEQDYTPSVIFNVRSAVPPASVLSALSREIQAYDERLPVFDARTMEGQLAFTVAPYKELAILLGTFGILAVTISFAGLYGQVAYQTVARTREIGIRMALGAKPLDVMTLMAKQGIRLVVIGIGLGLPVSVAVGQLISRFLFGIAALDPATYVVVPLLMAIISAVGVAIPALRGANVQPSDALRMP